MRSLPVAALTMILAASAIAQKTRDENQVRDRGRTPTADETQTLNRGRVGRQDAIPAKPLTLNGILVDAGCQDRSAANLKQPPMVPEPAPAENEQKRGSVSAHGVTVDSKTVDAERSDVLAHQVPDLRTRVKDPSCAVTGNSREFAILTGSGRLLNLDEGGNTLAMEQIHASSAGRGLLSGTAPAIKPKVTVKGQIHGDRVIVSKILKMEP